MLHLNGRALTTVGAITVDGVLAYTPIGCGSPYLTGPIAPILGAAECYSIFSTIGAVTNTGITNVIGDVGSNDGSATGYDPLLVEGTIHLIPDPSTAVCASDLFVAYNYINTITPDIELLYPAQFGNSLVLTPHTYIMQGAATFIDTLYLNAQGNADAVFVIQINGALSTSTYSNLVLINGALAKNVYWKVEGAVDINDYSTFCGTIISNNGALGALSSNVTLNGRLLTTNGSLTTAAMTANAPTLPSNCLTIDIESFDGRNTDAAITIYPNPFSTSTSVVLKDELKIDNCQFKLYNALGQEVLNTMITQKSTTFQTNLPDGVYFFQVIDHDGILQSGKLISQQ